jgi:hypothetical protein
MKFENDLRKIEDLQEFAYQLKQVKNMCPVGSLRNVFVDLLDSIEVLQEEKKDDYINIKVKRTATGYDIYYNGICQFSRKSNIDYAYMVVWLDILAKDTCPWWMANKLCKTLESAKKDTGKDLAKELNYTKYIVKIEY